MMFTCGDYYYNIIILLLQIDLKDTDTQKKKMYKRNRKM